jgi:cell division protein FtsQ
MKKPFHQQLEARKNRLKHHAGEVLWEIGRAFLLTGGIAAVTALLLVGYDLIIHSPSLSIRETVVRGCKELTEKEILALAAVRPAANLLTLNPDAIARRIKTNPWVRDVFIGQELPDRLVILVRERKAVAILQADRDLYLLDSEGSPFKKLDPEDGLNLPIITGCVKEGRTDETLVKKSLALLSYLASAKDIPAIGGVSEIHGNETFGLSLFTDVGLCLKLGFDGYENKLKRLTPVMADLDRKNRKEGFLLIDLNDPEKINVQQRNIVGPAGPAAVGRGYRM